MDNKKDIPPFQVKIKEVVAEFRKSIPNATKKELDAISSQTGKLVGVMKDVAHNSIQRMGNVSAKVSILSAVPVMAAVARPQVVQPGLPISKPVQQIKPIVSIKDSLTSLLTPLKIKLLDVREDVPLDGLLDGLAKQLGKGIKVLRNPLSNIKASRHYKGKATYSLPRQGRHDAENEIITSFFNRLHDLALITDIYYSGSSNNVINFTINMENESFMQFIDGFWFERYVFAVATDAMNALGDDYLIARNLKIKFDDGREAEIDVLVAYQGEIFLLEAKSRVFQQAVPKYQIYSKKFHIPLENTFFIILDEKGVNHKELEVIHRMRFLVINELATELTRRLELKSQKMIS